MRVQVVKQAKVGTLPYLACTSALAHARKEIYVCTCQAQLPDATQRARVPYPGVRICARAPLQCKAGCAECDAPASSAKAFVTTGPTLRPLLSQRVGFLVQSRVCVRLCLGAFIPAPRAWTCGRAFWRAGHLLQRVYYDRRPCEASSHTAEGLHGRAGCLQLSERASSAWAYIGSWYAGGRVKSAPFEGSALSTVRCGLHARGGGAWAGVSE